MLAPPGPRPSPDGVRRRILIVDDHPFFADCLGRLLESEADMTVCDVMGTADDLDERLARLQPDLLVIDITLGAADGLELGRRLREQGVATPIVFVSTLSRPSMLLLTKVGRCAFVAKTRRPDEILATLRRVLEGSDPKPSMPAERDAPEPSLLETFFPCPIEL